MCPEYMKKHMGASKEFAVLKKTTKKKKLFSDLNLKILKR